MMPRRKDGCAPPIANSILSGADPTGRFRLMLARSPSSAAPVRASISKSGPVQPCSKQVLNSSSRSSATTPTDTPPYVTATPSTPAPTPSTPVRLRRLPWYSTPCREVVGPAGGPERPAIRSGRMLPAWPWWIQMTTPLPAGSLRTTATTRIGGSVDTLWWRRSTILTSSTRTSTRGRSSFAHAGRAAKASIGSNASPGAPTQWATVVSSVTRIYSSERSSTGSLQTLATSTCRRMSQRREPSVGRPTRAKPSAGVRVELDEVCGRPRSMSDDQTTLTE